MLRRRHLLLATLVATVTAPVAAQQRSDSARAIQRPPADSSRARPQRDSLDSPVTPRRAFLSSLAAPGWGQSRLGRPASGAVYAGFEMTAIAMLAKSAYDLRTAGRRGREHFVSRFALDVNGAPRFDDSTGRVIVRDTVHNRYTATGGTDQRRSRLKARRLHYEDWVTLLLFNHLFAGADAYVAAHLFDVPRRVELRRLPGGAIGLGPSFSFR